MGAHAVGGYYSPNGNAWVRKKKCDWGGIC